VSYLSAIHGISGLISLWMLGETTGTNATDSAESNPGTYTGGFTPGQAGPPRVQRGAVERQHRVRFTWHATEPAASLSRIGVHVGGVNYHRHSPDVPRPAFGVLDALQRRHRRGADFRLTDSAAGDPIAKAQAASNNGRLTFLCRHLRRERGQGSRGRTGTVSRKRSPGAFVT
jgi:hypothetical protein